MNVKRLHNLLQIPQTQAAGERKGKERKGKERKGKERKGKERKEAISFGEMFL